MAYIDGIHGLKTGAGGESICFEQKSVNVSGSIINHACHVSAKITYKSLNESVCGAVFAAALNKHVQSAIYMCQILIDESDLLELEWMPSEKVQDVKNTQSVLTAGTEENCYKCMIGDIPADREVSVLLSYVYQIPKKEDELFFSLLPVLTPDKGVPCDILIHVEGPSSVSIIAHDQQLPLENLKRTNKKKVSYDMVLKEPLRQEMEVAFKFQYNKTGEVTAVCERGNTSETSDEFFGSDVAMVTFYPQFTSSGCPTSKGEFIFVIDRSSSMSGSNITHAKDTLLLFLKSLPVGCYFNVVSFGTYHDLLFKSGSEEYNGDTLRTACDYQNEMTANFGGTKLAPALKMIYKQKPIKDHPRTVFILTDGAAWDKSEAISAVKKHSSTTTVSAFGIGSGADKDMVKQLASEGHGVAEFVESFDRSMESYTALRMSMMTCAGHFEVNVTPPGGTTAEILGFRQEAVFSGDSCSFGVKLNGSHQTKKRTGKVEIKYQIGDSHLKTSCDLDWGNIPENTDYHVHRLVASHMIQSMLNKEDMKDKNIQDCYKSYSVSANLGGNSEVTKAVSKRTSEDSVHGVIEATAVDISQPEDTPGPSPGPSPKPVAVPHRALGFSARRKKIYRGNIEPCINKTTIKKISRRAGVGRMGSLCNEEIRSALKTFLETIIKDSVLYAENGRRKMVTEQDVDCSLRKNGIKIYGIEDRQPLPFEREDKKRRRIIKRSTPFGNPTATSSVVGSLLGVSAASKTSMKKIKSQNSLKKKLSKVASKTSLSRTSSIRSDVTASPPHEESNTRNKQQNLQRKSTEILNSSSDSLTLATPGSVNKPALSRVRSAMRNSTDSLKRKSSETNTEEPPAKVTKGQTRSKGKGKGKTTTRKPAAKGKKSAAARVVTVSRGHSVTRGSRPPVPSTSGGYKDFTSMVTMVTLQTFDGSWDMSQNLAMLIGDSKENLIAASPEKNLKSWATALALSWLEKNFSEQRMEWEMIHYKGNGWLTAQKNSLSLVNLMKAATKQL